jgi:tetratricopeptide (TPR) repeat protein
MAEYRAGDLERAVQLSLEAEKESDAGCRGGGMIYRAMALKRLGRTGEAVKVLQGAENLLAEPLARRTGATWWDLGLCELALDEARLLLAAELEQMRARWEPVRKLLDDGFSYAKLRQWPEARAAYAKALAEPAFDWLTAERASFDGCLSLQMAVVFAKAGDRGNYERLCRLLVDLPVDNSAVYAAERHAKSCFLQPADLPAEIQQRALAMARFAVTNRAGVPWVCHSAGMAEFRAGEFARASELLLVAEKSDDIGCRGGAMAYRALTLMRLGRQAEGNQVLKAAEQLLAGALKRRMDPY